MAGFGRIFSLTTAITNYRAIISLRNLSIHGPAPMIFKDKLMERLGLPARPKKPLTPFFKYIKIMRPKILQEYPQMKFQDIVKLIATKWADYDDNHKLVLQRESEMEMMVYSKKVMEFEQSITPEQKKMIKEALQQKKAKKERFAMKKKIAQLEKPKMPGSSFILYLLKNSYSKESEGNGRAQWVKNRAEEWKQMSPEEKEKYTIEAKKLMARYKEDMKEWEEKMVRMGHLNVVKNHGLIGLKSSKPE